MVESNPDAANPGDTSRPDSRHHIMLAAIFMVALALRLAGLGSEALWGDEFHTTVISGHETVREVVHHIKVIEPHPPLYFIFIHYWMKWVGDSDGWLRLPSVIAGAVSPLLLWLWMRMMRMRGALVAAALLAVSPMSIWYSQEARAYSILMMMFLLICMTTSAGVARLESGRGEKGVVGWWCLSGVLLLVTLQMHYFALFAAPAIGLQWLVLTWRRPKGWRLWLLPGAITFVGALVYTVVAFNRLQNGRGLEWMPEKLLAVHFIDIFRAPLVGTLYYPEVPYAIFLQLAGLGCGLALLAAGIYAVMRGLRREPARSMLLLAWCGCFVLPIVFSLYRPIIHYGQRHLIIALPMHLALIGGVLASSRRGWRWMACGLVAVMLLAQGVYLQDYYRHRQKRTWDTAAQWIANQGHGAGSYAVAPVRLTPLIGRYMPPEAGVNALTVNDEHELRAALAQAERPLFIVALNKMETWLDQLGITGYSVAELETYRPGQMLWIYVFPAAGEATSSGQ